MNGLLFIDDEEGVRRSIARALKNQPYKTYTVQNGEAGIDFVKKHLDQIATVISDYKMPGLDGLKTLSIIGGLNQEITRVILTGYATMEAAIAATNEGIDGFLTKPFDNVELRAKIHEIVVRKRLRQFVAEPICQEIENSPMALQPKNHVATILFSDIRDFTRMSENASPEAIAAFLNNHYFTPMGEIIHQHCGTLDKHIGDSIMVAFGTPLQKDDDTLRAVQAAVAMQQAATKIDAYLRTVNGLRLKTGIGIATGNVVSGIIGSMRKKEYTSLGMPVNIAARLQALAKAGEIIICRETHQKTATEFPAMALPPVTVKGLSEPIQVYRITV
jgi:adenylate cyclase